MNQDYALLLFRIILPKHVTDVGIQKPDFLLKQTSFAIYATSTPIEKQSSSVSTITAKWADKTTNREDLLRKN